MRGDIRSSRFATGVNNTGGKWKKSSIRKILIIWFGYLWVLEETCINFCLQVHFQVSAAWYCFHYWPPVSMTLVVNLPPVSLIPVAIRHRRRWHRRQIFRRYRWHRWQICHRCQQHKGNWWQIPLIPVANLPPVPLIPAAICHRWQICHRCRWHWWCTLTCEYLREFSEKFEMILMLLSGAWGKVIHEKNMKQKLVTLSLWDFLLQVFSWITPPPQAPENNTRII